MRNVAIVGAGPYGLSVAAHLRQRGIPFCIFGRPMDSWLAHMPKGMLLKSDGFASNVYDPDGAFTLERFCAERGIEYANTGLPVGLDTFAAYGLAFKERLLPELQDQLVVKIGRVPGGFRLDLDNGETAIASQVVLAVGITHFAHIPASLAQLPSEFVSHSFCHYDLEGFRGRSVAVIGGGSSAIDLAGLLHDSGAKVQLVARHTALKFHSTPFNKPRPWWQRIRHPQSGLGPGLRSRFFANSPKAFHYLPERIRLEAVRRTLGPSGGWFSKEKVMGRVPLLLGHTPLRANVEGSRVRMYLRSVDGAERQMLAEHIIAATGYRVDMERLTFLSREIRMLLKLGGGSPALSSTFESSVPGLYFAGLAAANSFGPVMRFAFGAGFAARTITRAMLKSPAVAAAPMRTPSVATTAK
jgi:hypothetical protein